MEPTIITWNEAVHRAEIATQRQQEIAEIKLAEFMESDIGMLDAMDIAYYSELTGIPAVGLRRMHPCNNLESLMHSYANDDTDNVLEIY